MQDVFFYFGWVSGVIAVICTIILMVLAAREGDLAEFVNIRCFGHVKFIINRWDICKIPFLLQIISFFLAVICFAQLG